MNFLYKFHILEIGGKPCMKKTSFTLRLFLLLPVLFLGYSFLLHSMETEPGTLPQNQLNSETALNRLIEISKQLSLLNGKLQSELLDSRQNSLGLQTMLEASKWELLDLRRELETLRIVSTELLNKAENSEAELNGLLTVLKKAEYSLVNLEQSFTAYRQTAETRISNLSRENRLWKWSCIAAGVIAAGFGTVLLAGR